MWFQRPFDAVSLTPRRKIDPAAWSPPQADSTQLRHAPNLDCACFFHRTAVIAESELEKVAFIETTNKQVPLQFCQQYTAIKQHIRRGYNSRLLV